MPAVVTTCDDGSGRSRKAGGTGNFADSKNNMNCNKHCIRANDALPIDDNNEHSERLALQTVKGRGINCYLLIL